MFEKLAQSISPEDRKKLLAAIEGLQTAEHEEPREDDAEDRALYPPELRVRMENLSIPERIILFFASLFSGKSGEQIVTSWLVRGMRARLQRRLSQWVDFRRNVFLSPFAEQLEELRRASGGLSSILDLVQDDRELLVTALAQEFFPEIHRSLLAMTSPEVLRESQEDNARILKQNLTGQLERQLQNIESRSATRMRHTIEQIDLLGRLADFSFSRMVDAFSAPEGSAERTCGVDYLRRSLESLATEFSALPQVIQPVVISTAVLASLQSGGPQPPQDMEEQLSRGIERVVGALQVFHRAARSMALVPLVRVLHEDPWWEPQHQSGGNDWLSIYRGSFQRRISRQVLQVSLNRQMRQQVELLEDILQTPPLPFPGLPADPRGLTSRHQFVALVVYSFFRTAWRDTMAPLRILLTTGDFYKTSNRAQYNDAFNTYEHLPERVEQLVQLLCSPEGWGGMLGNPEELQNSDDAQRLPAAMERIDEELEQLVREFRLTLEMLVNILGGVLYSRPGSSFDTIANYGQIGGRRNGEYIEELRELYARFQRVAGVLGEVDAIERRGHGEGIAVMMELPEGT